MHVISAVLFAVSANMDNIPLGIAYGIRGIRISFARNLLIALIDVYKRQSNRFNTSTAAAHASGLPL